MKFEQAFYTREMITGLGVYASSSKDYEFQNKCSRVGSEFETEPGQDTAEFVYYSDAFNRYVGVGVSPYSYENHEGRNKLVHIWVPEQASDDPSQYYLKYEFDRKLDKNRTYESREFFPVLSREDYPEILKKYKLSEKKLAELLEKVIPLLFRKKNFLAMILPDKTYSREECSDAARELTWLASMLAPVLKEDRSRYCRNLSYSVFSEENVAVVNMAYMTQNKGYKNFFELGKETEGKVSELCLILAKKAMESLDVYEDFIRELYTFRLEKENTIENFRLMFFHRNFEVQNREIKKEQIPVLWDAVIEKAIKDLRYRRFLYHLAEKTEDLSEEDLAKLHRYILIKDIKNYSENESEDFWAAYRSTVVKAFQTGNKLLYRAYLTVPDNETKEKIYARLWKEESVKNCVLQDMERAADSREFMELLKLYEPYRQKTEFLSKVEALALDKEYYFQLDKEEREKLSGIFGMQKSDGDEFQDNKFQDIKSQENEKQNSEIEDADSPWHKMLCDKVQDFFRLDQPYLSFLKKETGRIENALVPVYFSFYVQNCEKTVQKEERKQLQDTGYGYLKMYGKQVKAEDEERFRNLDKIWSFAELGEYMSQLSLKDLAEFQFKGFESVLQRYSDELYAKWYEEVLKRVQAESGEDTGETWEQSQDQSTKSQKYVTVKALTAVPGKMRNLNTKARREYQEQVWEYCGDCLPARIWCSASFGVENYTIWSLREPCEPEWYLKIWEYLKELTREDFSGELLREDFRGKLVRLEFTSVLNNRLHEKDPERQARTFWEFNRCCYLIWKQIYQREECNIQLLESLKQMSFEEMFAGFLEVLQEDTIENIETDVIHGQRISEFRDEDINYLRLQKTKEDIQEKLSCEPDVFTPVFRYEECRRLKEEHPDFFKTLVFLSKPENKVEDRQIRTRLEEIRMYETLQTRQAVSEENLVETSLLLLQAEKIFGVDAESVRLLRGEFEENMREIEECLNNLEKDIKSCEECKEEIERNIKLWNSWIEEFEKQIKKSEEIRKNLDNDIQKNQKSYEEKKENLNRAKNPVLSRNEKKYNGTNGKGTTGWQRQYENQHRPNPAMVPESQEQQKMPQQKPQTEEALMKTATANTVLPKTALSETEMPDELLKLTGDAEKY